MGTVATQELPAGFWAGRWWPACPASPAISLRAATWTSGICAARCASSTWPRQPQTRPPTMGTIALDGRSHFQASQRHHARARDLIRQARDTCPAEQSPVAYLELRDAVEPLYLRQAGAVGLEQALRASAAEAPGPVRATPAAPALFLGGALEAVLILPMVLAFIMAVISVAIWLYARAVTFAARAGGGYLSAVHAAVSVSGGQNPTVTVTVTEQALPVFPFWHQGRLAVGAGAARRVHHPQREQLGAPSCQSSATCSAS